MKDDTSRDKPSETLPADTTFKDRIESVSEIKYQISVILIDHLGLKAQSWLSELEAARDFHELQRAVFTVQNRLDREGKKDVMREVLAVWRAKTGY